MLLRRWVDCTSAVGSSHVKGQHAPTALRPECVDSHTRARALRAKVKGSGSEHVSWRAASVKHGEAHASALPTHSLDQGSSAAQPTSQPQAQQDSFASDGASNGTTGNPHAPAGSGAEEAQHAASAPCSDPSAGAAANTPAEPVNHNKQLVKALAGVHSLDQLISLMDSTPRALDMQAVTSIGSCLARLAQPHSLPFTSTTGNRISTANSSSPTFTAPPPTPAPLHSTHEAKLPPESPARGSATPQTSTPNITLLPPHAEPLPRLQAFALRVWQPLLIAQLPSSDAVGLSICLQAAAHLHLPSPALIEPLLLSLEFRLHTCSPHTLSQTLWALARLGVQPPDPWLRRWTVASRTCLLKFTLRDLSAVLWALAKLKWRPPESWMRGAMHVMGASLPQCDASSEGGQALATCVWSLAALRCAPPPELLDACLARAELLLGSQLGKGSPPSSSVSASASASASASVSADGGQSGTQHRTQQQHYQQQQQQQRQQQQQHVQSMQQQQQQHHHQQQQQQAQITQQQQHYGSENEVLRSSHNDVQEEPQTRARGPSIDRPQPFSPQAFSMLAYGLVVFQHRPSPRFVHCFVSATFGCLPHSKPQELALMVMALANWHVRPPGAWMARLMAASHPQLLHFSPQGLTLLLDAVAQLGYRPPAPWLITYEAALARKLPDFRPTASAQVLAAFGALGYQPQALLGQRLLSRMLGGERHMLAKRWFPALLSAALLGHLSPVSLAPQSPPAPSHSNPLDAQHPTRLHSQHAQPSSNSDHHSRHHPHSPSQHHNHHTHTLPHPLTHNTHTNTHSHPHVHTHPHPPPPHTHLHAARAAARSKQLLQAVLSFSRNKYAHCHANNLAQLALVLAIWRAREGAAHTAQKKEAEAHTAWEEAEAHSTWDAAAQSAQQGGTDAQQAWGEGAEFAEGGDDGGGSSGIIEGWLPGFNAALRQKVGLASAADVATLMRAASFFPPTQSPDTSINSSNSSATAHDSAGAQHDMHAPTGNQSNSHSSAYNSHASHASQLQLKQPIPSTGCLHLALLLLQACASAPHLYTLEDLLASLEGATTLGCSCLPPSQGQHREAGGVGEGGGEGDSSSRSYKGGGGGTDTSGSSRAVALSSSTTSASTGGTPSSSSSSTSSTISPSSTIPSSTTTSSSEPVRPQLSRQGSQGSEQTALRAAAAPLMRVLCDRLMQLLMEAQARTPEGTVGVSRAPHNGPTASEKDHFPDGPAAGGVSGAAVSFGGGTAAYSGDSTAAAAAVSHTQHSSGGGMGAQLRTRACTLLDRLSGSGTQQHTHGLLRAWACLTRAGYFDAAPSRAQQIQLCVAIYRACETQLLSAEERGEPRATQWVVHALTA